MPWCRPAGFVGRGARDQHAVSTPGGVEHFFRHEYGHLVALLSRRFGVAHIAAIEDAAQSALIKALELWTTSGEPRNPSAWLFSVARNEFLAQMRQGSGRRRILERYPVDLAPVWDDVPDDFVVERMQDDLLRMLFVCCDALIPPESQIVLALKTLCGFGIPEIATRLFASEASIYKRLSRARSILRGLSPSIMDLDEAEYAARVSSVCSVLYALFSEGYLSLKADAAIRRDLCDEVLRLTGLLANHPAGEVPEVFALMALMQLHIARLSGRQDGNGGLLLLEEQDRTSWDQARIEAGLSWLARSAEGDQFTRYHAEAGIAAEHCLAPTFEETRWDRVLECYALLDRFNPSPLNRLNRAVVLAEASGPAAALADLAGFTPPAWLARSYLWAAVLADLHGRIGDANATAYRAIALEGAPSSATRELLSRRLGSKR